jgi:hypothetical protein
LTLAQRDRAQYRLLAEPSAIGLNNPLTESDTLGPILKKAPAARSLIVDFEPERVLYRPIRAPRSRPMQTKT